MKDKTKILYIDDEEINVKLFTHNFSKRHLVVSGFCGNDGLCLRDTHKDIKIVITDMKMPHMNGLEFVSKAKKYIDKKYFVLTGYDITHEIKKAIDDKLILTYFRKPFDMMEIETAITEVT